MSPLSISAVVVSYHTGARLKECVFALLADPDVAELILVDNGTPAQMQAWLEEIARSCIEIQLLSGHGNIGFGAGINLGVASAKGPHILVINPDAVLRWQSLPGLQSVAENLSTPWIVGGRI